MELSSLFNKFNENLQFLRSNKHVDVHYLEIHPPVEEEVIDKIREAGFFIPDAVAEFYSACNGIVMNWSYSEREEGFSIYGSFSIMPLQYMFGGPAEDLEDLESQDLFYDVLWSDFNEESEIEQRQNLKVFETIEGDNAYVCLNYELKTEPELYYLSDFDLHKVDTGFEKYLGLILETMGLDVFRQMALLQESFDHTQFDYSTIQKMEKVFPWFNFEEIQEKYFED